MSEITVLIILILISLVANVVTINLYNSLKKEKLKVDSEIIKARSDLDFYIEVNKIKKEVLKNNEDEKKRLNSGDNHSRNSAAADILQNNKRN